MSGTLLATGLVVVGAGGALSCSARAFVSGSLRRPQALRSSASPGSPCSPPATSWGRRSRARSSRALGVDPTSGFFLFVLGVVGAPALFFATRYLAPRPGRPRDRSAHRRVPARTGARALRARSTALPGRLGADDARPRRDHPPAAPRPLGAELGLRLHQRHAPHGRRHVGRGAAPREGGCLRRRGARSRPAPARRSRSPLAALVGHGHEGGARPAAHLAPACAPDRPGARFGADERRDDQESRSTGSSASSSSGSGCCRRGSASSFSPPAPHRR